MDQKTLYIKLFDQHRDKLIDHDTPRYEHNKDLDLSFLLVDMKIGQDIYSTLFVHNTGPQPYKVFVYDKEIQPIQYAQTAYPECKLYTFEHISRKDLIDILVIPGKSGYDDKTQKFRTIHQIRIRKPSPTSDPQDIRFN